MIRVGFIEYSNSFAFLKTAKDQMLSEVEIITGYPGLLNRKLRDGWLQMSAISAYEYLSSGDQYELIEGVCINSIGYVGSVRLFSRKPFHELGNARIMVTRESATSVHLLHILLHENKIQCEEFHDFSGAPPLDQADAVLLIGDRALDFKHPDFPHSMDLAEEWTKLTGSPIVFAVWALRKDVSPAQREQASFLRRVLLKARNSFKENSDEWAEKMRESFVELNPSKEPPDFHAYYKNLDFDLDSKCVESLKLFAQRLVEINRLGAVPDFHFFTGQ